VIVGAGGLCRADGHKGRGRLPTWSQKATANPGGSARSVVLVRRKALSRCAFLAPSESMSRLTLLGRPAPQWAMVRVETIGTSLGDVEVAVIEGHRAPVLFFPGGHCSAAVDCGWHLYTRLGHELVAVSRPGYGHTRVGNLTAAEFMPAVEEVCSALGLADIAAVVGVSFGGLQAVHTALSERVAPGRLILHSAAPSTRPYPDSPAERAVAPILFGRYLQRATWAIASRFVDTSPGLKAMSASLSTIPVHRWWSSWSDRDREQARRLFTTLASGRGFANDLRQGHADTSGYRRWLLQRVNRPTLITASRNDGGVAFAHAKDFAASIPGAQLVELNSPTHLFWIGPHAEGAR
jgi:pimeloyl-ACP methyl ester carboxylesterase